MNRHPVTPQALMACLGDRSRFRLVRVLRGGPRCVTELAAEIGRSQSCTTRHLQVLARRRVVQRARDGKRVLYRLRHDEPALEGLLDWVLHPGAAPGASALAAARATRPGARPGPVPDRATDSGARARHEPEGATRSAPSPGPGPASAPRQGSPTPPAPATGPDPPRTPPASSRAGSRGQPDEPAQVEPEQPARPPWHRSDIEDYLL